MRITWASRACHVGLALVLAPIVAAPCADAESLAELLDAVAANARFAVPTRADVRIECDGCRSAGTPAAFLGRADTLYVEVRGGQRALVRPGQVLVARGGKVIEAVGERFADTDLLFEDLAVFTPASLKQPQISDDGPAGVVVTAAPAGRSPYALVVDTIDRDKRAFVRTLYYRDLINNLSKTRRETGLVRVDGAWRPGEITVETVRQATRTHLTLSWRAAPEAPAALFEPAGLEQASALSWP